MEDMNRVLSMERATKFLSLRKILSTRIALGVSLCLVCIVPAFVLFDGQHCGVFGISEDTAISMGLLTIVLMLLAAVFLFVHSGMILVQNNRIVNEPVTAENGVALRIREESLDLAPAHRKQLGWGIILCVLSPLPLIAIILLQDHPDFSLTLGMAALLILVASGAFLIVRTVMISSGYKRLLKACQKK